ncbi:MAG TPA: hypothetical protein PKM73_10395 [Verrucomicrobiota bacterium]|nr:hypothetical protein [Verrucomicrobiota bacterium]HNU51078.1 hypothetical protein [Verrucomicrobiota bacterium]
METFNDHVILPHLPDWTERVEWTRTWETGIAGAVNGSEERVAVRTKGRHSLRFTVSPYNVAERALLIDRLRASAKSGLAAVPFWGRGIRLAEALAGSKTVKLAASTPWAFGSGDPLFFCSPNADEYANWEVRQIVNLVDTTLTVEAVLTRTYPAGWFCWPMILGRLEVGDLDVRTDWHVQVPVEIRQLHSREDLALIPPEVDDCAIPLTIPGAGDSFDCYAFENPVTSTLDKGAGWTAAWIWEVCPFGVIAFDYFETYTPQDPSTQVHDGGSGWSSAWVFEAQPPEYSAYDSFETYSTQDPLTQTLDGGDEWSGGWTWEPES